MGLDHVEEEKSSSILLDSMAGPMNQTDKRQINKRKNSFNYIHRHRSSQRKMWLPEPAR